MSEKIEMKTPIAELDGDEMTRILWALIKEKLINPFVNLKTEYYDLGLENRDLTNDEVTYESAKAILRLGVGVKCATITANNSRMKEFNLKALYPSANVTIRALLDGTVFRKPILAEGIKSNISSWKKPIIIGRHAYGDVYKAVEMIIPGPGKVELIYTPEEGEAQQLQVADMKEGGIIQAMHNLDSSIISFARSCFLYALAENVSVCFGAKDTISKVYDGRFMDLFNEVYQNEFKKDMDSKNLSYSYTLIDDAVARAIKGEGGFLWACKNYDGDVMSDMVASAYGSLAMMTSVLVSPSGVFEYEAAHGTVQQHYYRWKKGEKTSTNPTALIFAWTGALAKRGELDNIPLLCEFAAKLENAVLQTIGEGYMTGDLAQLAAPKQVLDSNDFLDAVKSRLG